MPRGRRGGPALVAGLLLAGLAGCGKGSGDASQAAVRASAGSAAIQEPTTTMVMPTVPSSTATSTVPGATTTTSGRLTTTTSPSGRATTTATTVPTGDRALTPPVAGTYRYATSGATVVAGSTVVFPAVTTLVVDPPAATRQHSTRNLRDGAGNGTATEFTLDYRPNGVYLVGLRLTVGFSGATDTRDLTPTAPVLLLPTGARAGAHLEAGLVAGGGTARLVVDVLGGERLVIAGRAVDTLVMRATVSLPPGDVNGRQVLTVNVDPASGLWVKEQSVTDASAAGGLVTLRSEYMATIQRLTP